MTARHAPTQNNFRIFLLSFLESSYCLKCLSPVTLIKDVVKEVELCIGISSDLMHISFIDKGDLHSDLSLTDSNIVNGSSLLVTTSKPLETLFKSIIINQGLSEFFPCPTGFLINVSVKQRQEFIKRRLNTALLFSSGLGIANVCNTLICLGANINATTKLGRTALHIAAAHSSSPSSSFEEVIKNLVERGANMKLKDAFGETALDVAKRYGNRHTVCLLQRLNWLQRCQSAKPQYLDIPLKTFQMCDSANPKWRRNINGQIYLQVGSKC
ncbi:unnamed protein product [Trichobilharzia szidati]|nr:unnamed protein product [Trichobilharzia szidati]